jgi:hypothetical protein
LHLYVGNLLAQEFYFLQKTNHWLYNPRLPFLIENYFKEKSTSTLRPGAGSQLDRAAELLSTAAA